MRIIKQIVIPDINIKVLFVVTVENHFHVVTMSADQRFYRVTGKNVRSVVCSVTDTGRYLWFRYYEAKRLYRATVREYRKDACARAKKAQKLLSMAA